MDSKFLLELALKQEPGEFADQFVFRCEFRRGTFALVKQAAINSACLNFQGPISMASNQYQLPQMLVRDWDRDEFAGQLSRWFGG